VTLHWRQSKKHTSQSVFLTLTSADDQEFSASLIDPILGVAKRKRRAASPPLFGLV
jgi:hypothetical protein